MAIAGIRPWNELAQRFASAWCVLCPQVVLSHLRLLFYATPLKGGECNADNLLRAARRARAGGRCLFLLAFYMHFTWAIGTAVDARPLHIIERDLQMAQSTALTANVVENIHMMPPFEPWLPRPDDVGDLADFEPAMEPTDDWQAVIHVSSGCQCCCC